MFINSLLLKTGIPLNMALRSPCRSIALKKDVFLSLGFPIICIILLSFNTFGFLVFRFRRPFFITIVLYF